MRRRRIFNWILITFFSVCAGAGIAVAALIGRGELVTRMWTAAVVDTSGHATVVEAIDYDFGEVAKHGIYRTIPGLSNDAQIRVSSPDAPDQFERTDAGSEALIRIGDPARTIRGSHRYDIEYTLNTLTTPSGIAWNGIGTAWTVGMEQVELHLVAPFELNDVRCMRGVSGSTDACDVVTDAPGHVVVRAKDLADHNGVTIYASKGALLAEAPSVPTAPSDKPVRDGVHPLFIGAVVAVIVVISAYLAAILILRSGREQVGVGGPADAAWSDDNALIKRIDATKLTELATIEFAPPDGLTPAQGGVLLDETVANDHRAAWMMQASIDGFLTMEGEKRNIVLHRTPEKHGYATLILDQAFAGRSDLQLGKYDEHFAAAWRSIGGELEGWRSNCGLWDPAGDRRMTLVRGGGFAATVVGLLVGVVSAIQAVNGSASWMVPVATCAALFGAGISGLLFCRELRIRTVQGSGLWLRTESFRRFLHQSEAKHVEFAAEHNMLREYTAWAVALGEVNRWNNAMRKASLSADQMRDSNFYATAPYLSSAGTSASTAPSSSSSGGGGAVGGGGGGGGGGSW